MYTVGSLFTGIGGIDLAFEQAGFEISFQVEIDDYCNRVLEQNWPGMHRVSDVRNASARNLPRIDVLAGGFPCQDISLAGNGAGLSGERSGLWFEFERLIGELQPRVVFLENVPAITIRGGPTVIAALATLGYVGSWGVISAQDAGASHRRERWWCVAYANSRRQQEFDQGKRVVLKPDTGSGQDVADTNKSDGKARGPDSLGDRKQTDSFACSGELGYANSAGLQSAWQQRSASTPHRGAQPTFDGTSAGIAQSRMGGATYGIPAWLDVARPGQPQYDWEAPRTVVKSSVPHRASRLKTLGNAVVPQVVYPLAVEIMRLLDAVLSSTPPDSEVE